MQTTTKKSTRTTNLREEADAAIAQWRADESAVAAANEQHRSAATAAEKGRAPGHPQSPETTLALIDLEVRALELQDVARQSECRATAALDLAERAAGVDLAVACDPELLRVDLAELVAQEDRLRAEHEEARRRLFGRIAGAHKAVSDLDAERRRASLPPPARLPSVPSSTFGSDPRQLIELLANVAGQQPTPAKSNAEKIRRLRRDETLLRAKLEQQRIDREEAIADAARQRQMERKADEQRAREKQKETEAQMAKLAAERKRDEQLAAAHRARSAG